MSSLFDALPEDDWYKDEPPEPNLILATPASIDAALAKVLEDKLAQIEAAAPAKPGPVVTKRKRQGLQLCNVYNPAKPPKWAQVILEPKVDGYRCLARVEAGQATLVTSTQLPFGPNVRFIGAQLETAAATRAGCDNLVLDGEIVHENLPFDVAGGVLRLQTPDDRAEGMQFIVWDLLTLEEFDAKTSMPLLERKQRLETVTDQYAQMLLNRITMIDHAVGTFDSVPAAFESFLAQGYEGIVLKDAQGLYCYEGKAGTNWLKHKPFREGDFQIIGAIEGRGKHAGRLGAIKVVGYLLPDGNIQPDPPYLGEFVTITGEAGTGQALNDRGREAMWSWHLAGALAGRTAEIRYQDISPESSLRFPRFYRLRPDKD